MNYLLVLVCFFHSDYKLTFKMKRHWDLLLGTARKWGPGEKASYSMGCLTKEKNPRNRDTGVRLYSRKTGCLQDGRRRWCCTQIWGICPDPKDPTSRNCLPDRQGNRGKFSVSSLYPMTGPEMDICPKWGQSDSLPPNVCTGIQGELSGTSCAYLWRPV